MPAGKPSLSVNGKRMGRPPGATKKTWKDYDKHFSKKISVDKVDERAPVMKCAQPVKQRDVFCSGKFARIFEGQTHCQFCIKKNGDEQVWLKWK